MNEHERLSPEVVLIDGKHYRAMTDEESAEFIWSATNSIDNSIQSQIVNLALANAEVAMINATLIDFICEVAEAPYTDSDPASLLETLRTRAGAVLESVKDVSDEQTNA